MTTITIIRSGYHYTQQIIRDGEGVKCPISRNRAIEIIDEWPTGRFIGSGGFDTSQPHDWKWRADASLELPIDVALEAV